MHIMATVAILFSFDYELSKLMLTGPKINDGQCNERILAEARLHTSAELFA